MVIKKATELLSWLAVGLEPNCFLSHLPSILHGAVVDANHSGPSPQVNNEGPMPVLTRCHSPIQIRRGWNLGTHVSVLVLGLAQEATVLSTT